MGVLEARGLRHRLGGRWVVDGVSLTVNGGEIVGLLGPNGAGKTVTFYLVGGLLRAHAGQVFLDGEDLTRLPIHLRARHGLAYLQQERSVFHGLSVEDNIVAVLEARGARRGDASHRARKLLTEFGLGHVAGTHAGQLSGGEQRRLEIARCLATEPRFVLFDEPFAGLDPLGIEALHGALVELRRRGIGVLLTDHNVRETLALCDRAYVLVAGRVLAEGSAAELYESAAVRERFFGESFEASADSLAAR
jgi:lipopolysaccharide export system ATP-binding protein